MAFEESKHPRAKDGKFTSKGNEGKGGSTRKENTDSHDSSAILSFSQKERAKRYAQRYEESPKDVYNAIEKRFNEYRDKRYKNPLEKAIEDVLDDIVSNQGLQLETSKTKETRGDDKEEKKDRKKFEDAENFYLSNGEDDEFIEWLNKNHYDYKVFSDFDGKYNTQFTVDVKYGSKEYDEVVNAWNNIKKGKEQQERKQASKLFDLDL